MDSETLKILQQAVKEGVTSSAWVVLLVALVGAGIGAYLGAYLKKKGEETALRESFGEALKRLEAQTRVTGEIQHGFGLQLKRLESLEAESAFKRELYGSGLREYSTAQAQGLRQAYLVLFEPESSTLDCRGKTFDEQLEMAVQAVMQPLRSYSGILDEKTIEHVTAVQNELLELRNNAPADVKAAKNAIFNRTEMARRYVKADKIAFRLGLIEHPLEQEGKNG